MALFVQDTFTDVAGTTLATHTGETSTWAKHALYSGGATITDANRLRGSSTGAGYRRYYASSVPPGAEYDVEASLVIKSTDAGEAYIGARISTTVDTGYFAGHDISTDTWYLWKTVAGVYTEFGTWVESIPDEAVRTVKLRIRNATKKLYIDGVERISTTDNGITDAGRVGVMFGGPGTNTTGIHIDSITAISILEASGAPVLPALQSAGAASTSRSGAASPVLPSLNVSGFGNISTAGELTPAISDPFRVALAPATSAPFSVQAAFVGPGPMPPLRLNAAGKLRIQGELIDGDILALRVTAVGTLDTYIHGDAAAVIPSPSLSATGTVIAGDYVTIGGVRVLVFEFPQLEIEDWIEERSTCRFDVRDDDGSLRFGARQPVAVYDQAGAKIFGGYIEKVKEIRYTQAGDMRHQITCIDNHYKADKRRVAKAYENDAVDDIVANLVTEYLEDEDVTLAAALIDAGPTIGEAVFNYRPLSECLDRLAERVGFWWRIDHNAVLHFRERATETAPWTLTGADIVGTPDYGRSSPMYRNRQYIRGGRGLTDSQTYGPRNGDGVAREFVMGYPLAKVPTVEVNTVVQSVGIKGLDTLFSADPTNGKKWFWSKGDPILVQDSGATVLGVGDTIEVTYQGEFNLIAASEDTAHIIERQILEGGGSGIVEAVDDDASIGTRSSALEKAAALLTKYGIDGEELQFLTYRAGLEPGQVLTVDLPAHALDDDEMLVASVRTRRIRAAEGTVYCRTVTAILGPSVGSWAKFFLRLGQVPSFIDRLSVGEEGALATLHAFSESSTLAESVTFTPATCSFPATDLYPEATGLYPC